MSSFTQTMLVLSLVVMAGSLVVIALEMQRLRTFLMTGRIRTETHWLSTSMMATSLQSSPAGYAIYVFRGGQWVLDSDFSKPGYEAVPPSIIGSFEGQVVKKEAALKQQR